MPLILLPIPTYPHLPPLLGFTVREMRGKLAIGITVNFVNGRTVEETQVPEISGVARIYNQSFFQSLLKATGRDTLSQGLPSLQLTVGWFLPLPPGPGTEGPLCHQNSWAPV